jgi:hypothetical protein
MVDIYAALSAEYVPFLFYFVGSKSIFLCLGNQLHYGSWDLSLV